MSSGGCHLALRQTRSPRRFADRCLKTKRLNRLIWVLCKIHDSIHSWRERGLNLRFSTLVADMSKQNDLQKQIAALQADLARVTETEREAAVVKIKALMETHGVTHEHLGGSSKARQSRTPTAKATRAPRAGAGQPKYRDPKTGKTWTGFGRVPAWLPVRNRERFLIDQPAAAQEADSAPAPSKRAAVRKKATPTSAKSENKASANRSRAAKGQPAVASKKTRATAASKASPSVAVKTPRARRTHKASASEVASLATSDPSESTSA